MTTREGVGAEARLRFFCSANNEALHKAQGPDYRSLKLVTLGDCAFLVKLQLAQGLTLWGLPIICHDANALQCCENKRPQKKRVRWSCADDWQGLLARPRCEWSSQAASTIHSHVGSTTQTTADTCWVDHHRLRCTPRIVLTLASHAGVAPVRGAQGRAMLAPWLAIGDPPKPDELTRQP